MLRVLGFLIILAITGCATPNVGTSLDTVRSGMDKDKVLETAGNPKRTFREAMKDHWVYIYFEGNQEFRRDVVFENGKVVKVSQAVAREDWVKDLERSDSMEEFEQKAREHQKRAGQFKSIDGDESQGH